MDEPTGRRSLTANNQHIKVHVELDRPVASSFVAQVMVFSHRTFSNNWQKARCKKVNICVPHDFTEDTSYTKSLPTECCCNGSSLAHIVKSMETGDKMAHRNEYQVMVVAVDTL